MVVLAMILAMVGAPANTNFACDSQMPFSKGYTGWVTSPASIRVGGEACSALQYVSASKTQRVLLARKNAGLSWEYRIGRGLLIVTHEAVHAAGVHDECQTEKTALALLPQVLARVVGPRVARMAYKYALEYDATWPPVYHDC